MKPSGRKPPAMADGIEFDPNDVQALREWYRGDLKEGSARDLRARRTLAQMLRYAKPLDLGLRWVLADAFDPDGEGDLRLSLKRKRGRRKQINDRHVAAYVYQQTKAGEKFESAVEGAMAAFKVSRGGVTGAFSIWRPHFDRDPKLATRI
jgi:hypothetical protein